MAGKEIDWCGSAKGWPFAAMAFIALASLSTAANAQTADVLPPPGYPQGQTQPPPGYGPPPPGYGSPPPAYPNQLPMGYPGYSPYGYGYPPPAYYAPPSAYQSPPYVPQAPRRSQAAMISGIVLASVGGIAFIGGSVLLSDGQDRTEIYCSTSIGNTLCGREDDSERVAGGVALMIVGGLGVGVGIPLAIWGGSRVKPEIRVGASSASLSWRY